MRTLTIGDLYREVPETCIHLYLFLSSELCGIESEAWNWVCAGGRVESGEWRGGERKAERKVSDGGLARRFMNPRSGTKPSPTFLRIFSTSSSTSPSSAPSSLEFSLIQMLPLVGPFVLTKGPECVPSPHSHSLHHKACAAGVEGNAGY